MKNILLRCDIWLTRLDIALVSVAAAAILAMMGITFADVILRYIFNAPLPWAFDLIANYLLIASFFFAFSFAVKLNEHVAVDFFARRIAPALYHRAVGMGYLIVSVVFVGIGYLGAIETIHAWEGNEATIGALIWPIWPAKIIVPIGMFPLALRVLHRGLAHLAAGGDETFEQHLGLALSHDLIPEE